MDAELSKILLVEDDPIQASVVFNTLCPQRPHAFKIMWVDNYQEARQLLAQEKPNAILLDLSLPDQGGHDALLRVQADAPSIPIVVLVENEDDELMRKALRAGAQDCVAKTKLETQGLQRSLLHAMERHRFRKELHFLTDKYRQANLKLKQQVKTDPVTGLLNRRGLQEALVWELARGKHQHLALPVIFLDIDDFKNTNDRLGHNVGDQVLKSVGQSIHAALGEMGYAARVGGDEFLIVLPQVMPTDAVKIAERIRLGIANTPVLTPQAIVMSTASLGLELVYPLVSSVEELMAVTRLALEKAKSLGKNRLEMEMSRYDGQKEDASLDQVLQALRSGEKMHVLRQPIRKLENGREVGYQFQCRLGVRGFEKPEDFYHVSADHSMLTFVDRRCFDACLEESGRVNPRALCHLSLLPSTLSEVPSEELLAAFPDTREKQSYCLELQEHQVYTDPRLLREPVKAFKKEGVLIAVDGVGGGHSRLENLLYLEPDVLKIDRKLIRGIAENEEQREAVGKLMKLAKPLQMDVLAEGIESKEELECLKDMGVQFGQGALWGRALS